MKNKLLIGENLLESIKEKMGFSLLKESERGFRDFKVGDFVINNHGSYGYIKDTYDLSTDIRVHVGDEIEISCTGNNGYDTLEINGFHVFNVK